MSGKRASGTTTHSMLGHSAESSPEELLDVFKAAALSVTKLYKTSAAVQSKARIEGYQDCLEDLLVVLDKGDVDVRTIRRWIVERLDGREPILPTIESEDEVEKTEGSTPEPQPAAANSADRQVRDHDSTTSNANNGSSNMNGNDTAMHTEAEADAEADMETEAETPSPSKNYREAASSPMAAPVSTKKSKTKARGATTTSASSSASTSTAADTGADADVSNANLDHFTFRSTVPYPTNESYLELANLDLSDRRSASGSVKDASEPPSATATTGSTYVFNAPSNTPQADGTSSSPSHTAGSRQFRVRHAAGRPNGRSTLTARYNRSSAGQKRKLNFDEIFDLASLGYGKDVFGRGGGKRSRQA
ncbi:uncharacterized protein SPSK_09490 [Sporothrix schenckii 1099-18]|uniref:Uncharacterized protein n=2 Tax=Sporothrix schenckii TaxID=29908 RepID=U7Q7J0_SPOS1|nr:uncharacterized protein SPSK_09490 [Sporothrix schenckii 1099-18]ERT02990.1 hypothetical protein HMPREF1624_01294 [Sporothrix schenckii ATCC 58251]KJR84634.1 hypothetical protein SPSK_09490 [Sporothrix schenckii 1099-18]